MLLRLGFEPGNIHHVDDGQMAIEVFRTHFVAGKPFDLVLMDMSMPVLTGLEASLAIRHVERDVYAKRAADANADAPTPKHVPILAITAHATGEHAVYRSHGIQDVLVKPIKLPALKHMLEPYVDLSGKDDDTDVGKPASPTDE